MATPLTEITATLPADTWRDVFTVDPIGDPETRCPHRLDHTYFGALRCRKRGGHVDGLGTGAVTHEAHVGPGLIDLIRWVTWNTVNLAAANHRLCDCPRDARGNACNGTCRAKETPQ